MITELVSRAAPYNAVSLQVVLPTIKGILLNTDISVITDTHVCSLGKLFPSFTCPIHIEVLKCSQFPLDDFQFFWTPKNVANSNCSVTGLSLKAQQCDWVSD